MTAAQYKKAIADLGMSQAVASDWLGVSPRTGQRYAADGPPEAVAKLLRLMIKLGLTPQDVK